MIPPALIRILSAGCHILPCARTSKAAAFKGALDAASNDPRQVAEWVREFPSANWRIALGKSGLMALDVDRPGPTHVENGFETMAAIVQQHGPLPPRPTGRSGGSGGLAMLFKHQGEPLRGKSGALGPGIDTLRGRQSLMIEPSRHPITKGQYRWLVWPDKVPPPPIPAWLAQLLAPPPEPTHQHPWTATSERARTALMRATLAVSDAPSGAANDTLNRAAFRLGTWCGAGLLTESEAAEALVYAATKRRIPAHEARATIRSGISAGRRNPVQSHAGG